MVKAKTLQIVWHCKEPVFSLDFSPNHGNMLATGGADKDIKLWEVIAEADGSPGVSYVCSLGGVSSAVNTLRFSPLGDVLASGGDSGEVLLWKQAEGAPQRALGQEVDGKAPTWKVSGALRGHAGDVHDLAWSPDGSAIISGSVENWAMLWDVEARRGVGRLDGHQHYVQGVAWDPLGHNLITLSNDRTAHVYGCRPPALSKKQPLPPVSSAAMLREFHVTATLSRRSMADNNDAGGAAPGSSAAAGGAGAAGDGGQPPAMAAPPARQPLFQDEDLASFFRRPAWSPDGSFVVLPAGLFKVDMSTPACPTAYIFARGDWSAPVAHLPSLGRPPVVVRFSPVLYRLREGEGTHASSAQHAWEALPYRMVWAVGTLDSVMVYDTQCLEPLLLLGGLHMSAVTDLAWSSDGLTLAVSSSDGYCSIAMFEASELGVPIPPAELPQRTAACVTRAAALRFAERQQAKAAKAALPMAAPPESSAPAPMDIDSGPGALKRPGEPLPPAATPKRPANAAMVQAAASATPACGHTKAAVVAPAHAQVIVLDQDDSPPRDPAPPSYPACTQQTPRQGPVPAGATPSSLGTGPVHGSVPGAYSTPSQQWAGVNTSSNGNSTAPRRRIAPVAVHSTPPEAAVAAGPGEQQQGAVAGTTPVTATTERIGSVQNASAAASPAVASINRQARRIAPVPVATGSTAGLPTIQVSNTVPRPAGGPASLGQEVAQTPGVSIGAAPCSQQAQQAATGITAGPAQAQVTDTKQRMPQRICPTPVVPSGAPAVQLPASTPSSTTADVRASSTAVEVGAGTASTVKPPRSMGGFSLAMLAAQAGRQAASGNGTNQN